MKIVFAASEAAPYIKTGGLGDVARALPRALAKSGEHKVTLFLPYYKKIKNDPSVRCRKITDFRMALSWRDQYVGLFKLENGDSGAEVFFVDNEYYFNRDGIYGYDDDGERFAYFDKAILESLCRLKEVPDVIHCNDWQTALIPVLLNAFYYQILGSAKTVFTIHNIEYQGWAHPYFLGDVLGLDTSWDNVFKMYESLNFMKAAVITSDAVTTVSRTYAREITDPYFAHGLDGIIRDNSFKLTGIINGIDPVDNDPETDKGLAFNYGPGDHLSGKQKNKEALFEKLGLSDPSAPLIGTVSRLAEHKGMDLICGAAEEILSQNVRIAVLGTGDPRFEEAFRDLANRYPDRFSANIRFDRELASMIYASSDLYLMPSKSEPCGLSQMIAMRYGAVPVVHETGGLADTVPPRDPAAGTGLGFTFRNYDCPDMNYALRRALELKNSDRDAWNALVTDCMTTDFSWDGPAKEYVALYKKLTRR